MGGNALKNTKIERFDLYSYNLVKNDILNKLEKFAEIKFIIDAPNKRDFGDLDILYKTETNMKLIIVNLFDPVETITNGNILSFAYSLNDKYYQIDMIETSNFEMSQFYYSYGDVGNILGRMVRESGLKLGVQGLFYHDDNLDKEIVILSNEPKQICEYLGLEYSKWGLFQYEHEIFNWIISSRFFVNEFHCRSKDKRKRKVRPMLQNYMDFIIDKPSNVIENKQSEALLYFQKSETHNNIILKKHALTERKKKFNGNKIMKYGFENKSVGFIIQEFKNHINKSGGDVNDYFEIWLDTHDEEYIDSCLNHFASTISL